MRQSLLAWAGGARADLHVHTCASDSAWTPEEVIRGCTSEGIDLLAIADHDTTASVAEAESLALQAGLGFVPAVEVSSTADGVLVHLLAYGIDTESRALQAVLETNRERDEARRAADAEHLGNLGYSVSREGYLAYAYDRRRGGFKLLNYLVDQGIVSDIRDYARTISPQLPRPWADYVHPADAVAAIRDAGGIPVMAHPGGSLAKHGGATESNLARMLDYGLVGFECFSRYHDLVTMGACLHFCYQRGLIVTGGSDFHGHVLGRRLGYPLIRTDQLRLQAISDHIHYRSPAPVLTPAD